MPIIVSDTMAERGKADAERHSEKQKDAIRGRLPEIIAEESIITGSTKGRVVRVPIREVKIPIFRHGSGKGSGEGGIGQGKGSKGDVIGKRPAPGTKPGQAGSEPGVDFIETEMELDKLIEMMLDNVGLPRLEKKDVREILVELGFRIRGTQRTGPFVLLNKRKTAKEGMRRFWHMLRALQTETGNDELMCFRALKEASGIHSDALDLLRTGKTTDTSEAITPFPILHSDDLRFHKLVRKTALHSQAAVLLMRDASASMDEEKVFFARALCYWIVTFLRKLYARVEIRFILHDTNAWLVNEDDFFSITTSGGGTQCSSAYELAQSLIDTDYPISKFNLYAMHFSDGDDFVPERSARAAQALLEKGINMFGYCEVRPGEERDGKQSALLKNFRELLDLEEGKESGLEVFVSKDATVPFFGLQLRDKSDILPAIKTFLKQDRWVQS